MTMRKRRATRSDPHTATATQIHVLKPWPVGRKRRAVWYQHPTSTRTAMTMCDSRNSSYHRWRNHSVETTSMTLASTVATTPQLQYGMTAWAS